MMIILNEEQLAGLLGGDLGEKHRLPLYIAWVDRSFPENVWDVILFTIF